jgi:hypothetical protein
MKHAIENMRHVYDNRDEAKAKGQLALQGISDNFTWDKIGDKVVERLVQIDQGGK